MFMAAKIGLQSPRASWHHFHGMLPRLSMDHVRLASAVMASRTIAKSCTSNSGEMRDGEENKLAECWSDACGVLGHGFVRGGCGPAQAAVVYCKTVGVPQGCVARPTPVAVVAAPVVGVRAVGVGARGVGVRAGTPMNRGGPVNRVGRR
jgi:hypothetical protein